MGCNNGMTIKRGKRGSVKIVTAGSLNDLQCSGTYFFKEGTTNRPRGLTNGSITVTKMEDADGIFFLHQEVKGLKSFGDKSLSTYERFIFPSRVEEGKDASSSWVRQTPSYEWAGNDERIFEPTDDGEENIADEE